MRCASVPVAAPICAWAVVASSGRTSASAKSFLLMVSVPRSSLSDGVAARRRSAGGTTGEIRRVDEVGGLHGQVLRDAVHHHVQRRRPGLGEGAGLVQVDRNGVALL